MDDRNVDGAKDAHFGTIDAWLVYKLCGEAATDYTNASRTMLFDIRSREWDGELCELLGVDPAQLPEARPSAGVFGTTKEFGGEVPVAGIAGDQQAALFGQACHTAGEGKNTYGTGSFVLLNAGTECPDPAEGLLTTVAWGIGDEVDYALEAAIFVTGAAVQWLRDGLGIIREAKETEAMAASLDSNGGVYFVPALTGLGSPHWDPYARGTIVGLTRGSTREHLARAALEAIAYQTVDAVRAQENVAGKRLEELKADGGAVVNDWLMQFQADVLGTPVVVPEISETTALGAAYLAGIGPATGRPGRCGRCGGRHVAMSRRWTPARRNGCSRIGGKRCRAQRAGPGSNQRPTAGVGEDARRPAPASTMSELKPQVYKDDRPAEAFAEFHERSRTKDPNWVYGVVRVITSTIALTSSTGCGPTVARTCRAKAR